MNPQFPLYIVSKGRADTRMTARALERLGVPFYIVVEEAEADEYRAVIEGGEVLVLDPAYQRNYETLDSAGDDAGKGPGAGPPRNFAWDHAVASGHDWHWVMDDNIQGFWRLYRNRKLRMGDGTGFRVMEDFCLRYANVAMAGPNYYMFASRKSKMPPFVMNTRIYSCNLIRNDVPFRWRGRLNEDTILSLDMLKAGWCTVQFNAFLQWKTTTQLVRGGNTAEFYAKEGTLRKSEILVETHPDVSRLAYRFSRIHHYVDYGPFKSNRLVRADGVKIEPGVNDYGLVLTDKQEEAG